MKILFLHGLESNNRSSKVTYMRSQGHEVLAPSLNYYANPKLYLKILKRMLDFKPKLIVGSSMGGYFALHLGTHFSTNILLLNPALPYRTIEPEIVEDGQQKSKLWALLGKNDNVIDPIMNENILKGFGAIIKKGNHFHRTPQYAFESFFNEVLENL